MKGNTMNRIHINTWLVSSIFSLLACGFPNAPLDAAEPPFDTTSNNAILITPEDTSSARNLGRTIGNSFALVECDLVATKLGVWDQGGDGLETEHKAGIWILADGKWDLIVSATIPAGDAAELFNGFRYVTIPDTVLPKSRGYVIGALFFNSGDKIHDAERGGGVFSLQGGVGIRFDEARLSEQGDSIKMPTQGVNGVFGPGRWAGATVIFKKKGMK